jgi:carbon starvation protein CstA
MRRWTRWQDWVALVAGVYAALAPIWTETDNTTTWTMVILGAVTAVVSVWSLAMPDDRISEYIHAALGVLFFVAPWAMQFTDLNAMAYTAWAVGIITFVMGVWALPQVQERLHHAPLH